MKKEINIRNLLHHSVFQTGMAQDFLMEYQNKNPTANKGWIACSLNFHRPVAVVTDIFIKEIQRGHIFYDDLFHSALLEYTIDQHYYDEETRIAEYFKSKSFFKTVDWYFIKDYTPFIKVYLLCYDFCKKYLHYFDNLIKELYHICAQTDNRTINALFKDKSPSDILVEALQIDINKTIQMMENKDRISYLHTKNNLKEILDRIEESKKALQRSNARKQKKIIKEEQPFVSNAKYKGIAINKSEDIVIYVKLDI